MLAASCKSLLRSWKHNFAVQMTTLSVLSGVCFIIIVFTMIYENLDGILSRWGQEVQMTVFLDEDLSVPAMERLRANLTEADHVEKVDYVSKADAARRFLNQMGSLAPDFLSDKKFGNPLPASLEVSFVSTLSKASSLEKIVKLAEKVVAVPGVEDVSYGQGWIENYSSVVSQFARSSWFIIIVLMSGSLLIVGNAIRNSVHQKRDEVEVLELIGATTTRIQAPFIIEGVLFGFISAVIALVLAYIFFAGQSLLVDANLSFLGLSTKLEFLSFSKIVVILMFSTFVGALGSWLCVRSLATGWSAARRLERWGK